MIYMTEDDTFRILANRISFYEMMKIYRSGRGPKWPDNQGNEWVVFMAKYGWTWEEFKKHWIEWNGGQGTYSDYEKKLKEIK